MTSRRVLAAAVVSLLLLFSFSALAGPTKKAKSEDEPPAGPTILCYHIVEAPAAPRMHISREVFRQHLRYLEMTGYNVIPLRHAYEYATGKRASIPRNSVVITIDDGWRSTYTEMFPELQKRKFPFTVFIYPNIIGKTANALSWDEIKEMSDAGVDIQSHSLTHPYLTRRRHRSMGDEQYAKWIERELAESRRVLEKKTGKKVHYLAYPFGDYDEKLLAQVKKAGYKAALTCDFGHVRKASDPFRMRRFVIDDRMDFADFRRYLGTKPLEIADPTPKGVTDPAATVISARIPNHDSVDPKSVGMALLSLGTTVPYSYDARSGSVSLVLAGAVSSLKSKTHRAVVWANDLKTGRRVEATWIFRLPEPEPAAPAPLATAPAVARASTTAGAAAGGSPKR